jgi:hypothetical protein
MTSEQECCEWKEAVLRSLKAVGGGGGGGGGVVGGCLLPDNTSGSGGGCDNDELEMAKLAAKMSLFLDIRTRRHHLRTYRDCFLGTEAVQWLCEELDCDETEAIATGNAMLRRGMFSHVVHEHLLENAPLFYAFSPDFLEREEDDDVTEEGRQQQQHHHPLRTDDDLDLDLKADLVEEVLQLQECVAEGREHLRDLQRKQQQVEANHWQLALLSISTVFMQAWTGGVVQLRMEPHGRCGDGFDSDSEGVCTRSRWSFLLVDDVVSWIALLLSAALVLSCSSILLVHLLAFLQATPQSTSADVDGKSGSNNHHAMHRSRSVRDPVASLEKAQPTPSDVQGSPAAQFLSLKQTRSKRHTCLMNQLPPLDQWPHRPIFVRFR